MCTRHNILHCKAVSPSLQGSTALALFSAGKIHNADRPATANPYCPSFNAQHGHDGSHYSVGSSPLFVESVFSVRTRKECVNFHPFSDYWLHSFNRLDIFLGQLFPVVKLVFDVAHFQKLKAKNIGNCIFDDRFSIFVPGNPFSSMFSEADLF